LEAKASGRLAVGISTGALFHLPLEQAVPLIAQAGFSFVELWIGKGPGAYLVPWDSCGIFPSMKALFHVNHIRAESIHAPYEDGWDLSHPEPSVRGEAINNLRRLLLLGSELQVRTVVVHGSSLLKTVAREYGENRILLSLRDAISRVTEVAKEVSITLALETLLPHFFTGDAETLLKLLDGFANDEVGICFDTGHCFLWPGPSLHELFEALSSWIVVLHVHDNDGERDDHLSPGKGSIDWRKFASVVHGSCFRGRLFLESAVPKEEKDILGYLRILRLESERLFLV
jgi:sugar phosphate isomerase/epimerase